jgi:hypothetical protein
MMKKILFLAILFSMGCNALPTPDDFPPPPPMTPIVEFPQVTPTTTLEPNLRPVLPDDMQEAKTFFLILKTAIAAGDDTGVAQRVRYPVRVRIAGKETFFPNPDEFLANYQKIFDQEFVTRLSDIDETNLTLLPNGVQVGNGELWFNYYCVDLSCSDSQFLITQINK